MGGMLVFFLSPLLWLPDLPPPSKPAFLSLGNWEGSLPQEKMGWLGKLRPRWRKGIGRGGGSSRGRRRAHPLA